MRKSRTQIQFSFWILKLIHEDLSNDNIKLIKLFEVKVLHRRSVAVGVRILQIVKSVWYSEYEQRCDVSVNNQPL